jgi:CsoR family transcriptional regulator, copper-sensing transcriptional repressor
MSKLRDPERKRALVLRLKRVEGQLRGIQGLIEAEADCEKIAQQLAASRKALDKTFFSLVGCLLEDSSAAAASKAKSTERARYIATMLSKFA